eukprot:6197449-Pleurochrysis_carterae.AAC.1
MGSCSRWAAGVCARLRSDAKAGGVTRAASTRARTYADSSGPSATRPPSASPAAPVRCAVARSSSPVDVVSRSASAAFIRGG